ncbi:TIGR02808 family protein [Psychromonas sp. CD1]|nr:TIGR02808 family protein [Psychromonas sp. CD1]
MSNLESIFWHILGYAAMPVIFLGGFVAVFFGAAIILHFTGNVPTKDEPS